MTCIAAVVSDGRVHIGGDSAGVSGFDLVVRRDPKVFLRGEFAFGFTTSFRMGQLIQHSLSVPPPPKKRSDLQRYMVADFTDALRSALKASGWQRKQEEQEVGGTLLVGVRGRLFRICDDYQVGESASGFDAVGCGSGYALGALHASAGLRPKRRLLLALRAAERWSAGVRGPFRFVVSG